MLQQTEEGGCGDAEVAPARAGNRILWGVFFGMSNLRWIVDISCLMLAKPARPIGCEFRLVWTLYQSYKWLPSGKQPHNYGKIHHFQWVNPLFRLGHFQ